MASHVVSLSLLCCIAIASAGSPAVHKAILPLLSPEYLKALGLAATCDDAKFLGCTKQFMTEVEAPTTFTIQDLTSFMLQYTKSFMTAASLDGWCTHVSAYKSCTGGQAVWDSCLVTTELAKALGLTGILNKAQVMIYAALFAQTGVFCDKKEVIKNRMVCLNNLGDNKYLDPDKLKAYEKECVKGMGFNPEKPDCDTVSAFGSCDGKLVLSCGKDIAQVLCEAGFAQFRTYAGEIGMDCPDLQCHFDSGGGSTSSGGKATTPLPATCDDDKFLTCATQLMKVIGAPAKFSAMDMATYVMKYAQAFMGADKFSTFCAHINVFTKCVGNYWDKCLVIAEVQKALGLPDGKMGQVPAMMYAWTFAQAGTFCANEKVVVEQWSCLNNLDIGYDNKTKWDAAEKACVKGKGFDPSKYTCKAAQALLNCDGELVKKCGDDIAQVFCCTSYAVYETLRDFMGLGDLKCSFGSGSCAAGSGGGNPNPDAGGGGGDGGDKGAGLLSCSKIVVAILVIMALVFRRD